MDSRGSTLTPCSSPAPPSIPVQPDHFYGSGNVQLPPSPHSDGKTWLDPADDPMANRGIPVFKPTMEEFRDFETYMNRVECWGSKSGIVKVIPPKEWTESLPPLKEQLKDVKIKTPIEQHMRGRGGLFRQENMEKRKVMSVREWVELCTKDEFRAPGITEVGLTSRNAAAVPLRTRPQRKSTKKVETGESTGPTPSSVVIKEEPNDEDHHHAFSNENAVTTPPNSEGSPPPPVVVPASTSNKGKKKKQPVKKEEPKPRPKRVGQTREAREASQAERAARDLTFLDVFDPDTEWLPPGTIASDYTPEFCQKLERQYWRNCGLGKPAWYGADTLGSLFTDATTSWNVGHLSSALSRLLPASDQGLPGVNTPYLYFGMWRATFAWHVEDMDLFSINYIHFGAPKFWYAIPQARASGLETTMRSYFPKDTSHCPQFLRHKSFLASPSILAKDSCRPNYLVQQAGEFVITYPRGYHAGFNLGMNCAESVNFALDSWLDVGRRAKVCECISDSVRIDVDQLLQEREEERLAAAQGSGTSAKKSKKASTKHHVKKEAEEDTIPMLTLPKSKKRKSDVKEEPPKLKKIKITHSPSKLPSTISIPARPQAPKLSVTLKLGPRPTAPEPYPCCLCISMNKEGLLRVHDPPLTRKDAIEATGNPQVWMAHELCASVIPETWVDEVDTQGAKEKMVFGVDGIVKDRWNLKCSACTKNRPRGHGAPVQCTKGKCPRAFHVGCARDGADQCIVFDVVREVEKEVLVLGPSTSTSSASPMDVNPVDRMQDDPHTILNLGAVSMDTAAPAHIAPPALPPKFVKKLEVQILCTQHNPAVSAQKKTNKNNKIRADLLALPSMARIKIRVSSGVFEVSLIRVIEESSSVEVLWDRGLKKEFKWGSVVFGNTDGPVLQKPSEIAPEPERPVGALPVTTYPSVMAATTYPATYLGSLSLKPGVQPAASGSSQAPNNPQAPMYQSRTGSYDYWAYAAQYTGQVPYANYGGYYSQQPPTAGSSQTPNTFNPYAYATQTYNSAAQYRGTHLNWQQPYQGPPQQAQSQNSTGPERSASDQPSQGGGSSTVGTPAATTPLPQVVSSIPPSMAPSDSSNNPTPQLSRENSQLGGPSQSVSRSDSTPDSAIMSQYPPSVYHELAALSTLQPEQIAEILRNNAHLRDIVWAAVDQAKKTET